MEEAQPHQGQSGGGIVSAEVLSSRVILVCVKVKIDSTAATPAASPGPSVRTAPLVSGSSSHDCTHSPSLEFSTAYVQGLLFSVSLVRL